MKQPPKNNLSVADNNDAAMAFRKFADSEANAPARITLDPKTYDLHPDRASETFAFIANNDEGLKRIAIHLTDRDGVEIDGQGALLRTHGAIIPIFLERCRNVVLKNFTIDAAVPFHVEARVIDVKDGSVDVHIPESYPYEIVHGRLRFPIPGQSVSGHGGWDVHNILEFDPRRRETAFKVFDNYGIGQRMHVVDLGNRRVRLIADFQHPRPQVDNVLVITGFGRCCPAIVLSECADTRIENVTLHQAGGMGVIAQRCENLHLDNVRVTPSDDRVVSLTCDATHFVGCRGQITIENCLFENQMDDPVNIHGVYTKITARPSANVLEVKLTHGQQLGFKHAAPGDRMELVRNTTLLTYHEAVVTGVEVINKEYARLTFDAPLPSELLPGDAVGNLTWTPDVTIRNCRSRGNRARGFLLTTPGKILIEDNYFHTPGPALLMAGDANYWFESGNVRDLTIRRNEFDNCNYGVWGTGAIEFHPEVEPEHRSTRPYHRNVTIEDNVFTAFDPRIITGWGVEGIRIRRNQIIGSDQYSRPANVTDAPYTLTDCTDVAIEDGTRIPAPPMVEVTVKKPLRSVVNAITHDHY